MFVKKAISVILILGFLFPAEASILHRSKRAPGSCRMQDTCGENENGFVPCAVERDNHKFEDSDKVLAILRSECPELFVGKSADYIPDVCCSPDDVMRMQKNMDYV